MRRLERMHYDYATREWVGRTANGQYVHVSSNLYQATYHEIANDKQATRKYRGDQLRRMLHPTFWAPVADAFGPSRDIYFSGTPHMPQESER